MLNPALVSCYLFPAFRKSDIVLIYDHKNKALKFFLSKREREKMARYGVHFYQTRFPQWKKEITKNIIRGQKLIAETKEHARHIPSMSMGSLKKHFLARTKFFQKLATDYFYTESFFLDDVEKLIASHPKKYKTITDSLRKAGALKLKARKILNSFYTHAVIFRPYIDELANRLGRHDLQWLSFQKIIGLANGRNVPLSNRGKTNWIITKHNQWQVITGKKAERIKKDFDQHFFHTNVQSIQGTVANRGKYIGQVKIVRTIFSNNREEEIKKVKKGDILVAETTGPEMIAACQRAGAIITDEGGITSHAAIISRELGIPCIIGTKIASHVLKDGQRVEVDAEKGIIRIRK